MITRFAPSPTGFLHLGHALAAQQAFGFASRHGGACLLRIEDIDHTRCTPEFSRAITQELHWLGFTWPQPVLVQSQRRDIYENILENLSRKGLIYKCFLTRKQIAAASASSGIYAGPKTPLSFDEVEARIDQGEPFAWRLSLSRAREALGCRFDTLGYIETNFDQSVRIETRVNAERFGDEVLARKDIGLSYYLAATHDDAAQNISHIVRGKDLEPLTGFQVLLQNLMGWPTPIYHHHALIMDDSGDEKLSKRSGSTALRTLRAAGYTPQAILDMAKSKMSS